MRRVISVYMAAWSAIREEKIWLWLVRTGDITCGAHCRVKVCITPARNGYHCSPGNN